MRVAVVENTLVSSLGQVGVALQEAGAELTIFQPWKGGELPQDPDAFDGLVVLGGEQSGHVILSDFCTTGDGQMTAALLLQILKQSGKKASELAGEIQKYPQILVNVRTTNEGKAKFKEDEELQGFIEAAQQELFDTGRVLVRVSGTEPLIRIMVEGRDEAKIGEIARDIEEKIKERIG